MNPPKMTPTGTIADLTMPMSFRDVYESILQQGIPAGTAIGLLAIFGMGVQNYEQQRRSGKLPKLETAPKLKKLSAQ